MEFFFPSSFADGAYTVAAMQGTCHSKLIHRSTYAIVSQLGNDARAMNASFYNAIQVVRALNYNSL